MTERYKVKGLGNVVALSIAAMALLMMCFALKGTWDALPVLFAAAVVALFASIVAANVTIERGPDEK